MNKVKSNPLTKEQRAKLIGPLMYYLDLKAHRLYWVSDEELLELAAGFDLLDLLSEEAA